MITVSKHMDDWGNTYLTFAVPLPEGNPVFMSVKIDDYNSDKSGIVLVDSSKFLELWRNEPFGIHTDISFGSPATWRTDRKYEHAEKGFSYGSKNPVPLAYISHGMAERIITQYKFLLFGKRQYTETFHYVGFTNGITRTIWLLSQGCMVFPVECEMPGAKELHRVAGAINTVFDTVGSLAKKLIC